jgi:hypothetical protein
MVIDNAVEPKSGSWVIAGLRIDDHAGATRHSIFDLRR